MLLALTFFFKALPWYVKEQTDDKGAITYPHTALINPIMAGIAAILLVVAVLWQAKTASNRHEAQTKADLQQRITETFSNAVDQLGSEKMEARIGGIYTLESLAREALVIPDQIAGFFTYWTVMEMLAAFVRERAKWPPSELPKPWEQPNPKPPTDIAAVLEVIRRRPEAGRRHEEQHNRRFDLRATDLRGAELRRADLSRAYLAGANRSDAELFGVKLRRAVFQDANLSGANFSIDAPVEVAVEAAEAMATFDVEVGHLDFFTYLTGEYWATSLLSAPFPLRPALRNDLFIFTKLRWADLMADLSGASLVRADLRGAKLGGACLLNADIREANLSSNADLRTANLSGADLRKANLRGADLRWADLRGADLGGADLSKALLSRAIFAGAKFQKTQLAGANLTKAHFEGVDMSEAFLDDRSLGGAYGDSKTRLPRGVARSAYWPSYDMDAD